MSEIEMFEVRREDGELCGFVVEEDGHFQALTIFLVPLMAFHTREEASEFVLLNGLAVLAAKWFALIDDAWEMVVIQEANPIQVTVNTDIFGGGGAYGESHTFIAATDRLRLADPLIPLS